MKPINKKVKTFCTVVTEELLKDSNVDAIEMVLSGAREKGYVPVMTINYFPLTMGTIVEKNKLLMKLSLRCCYIGKRKAKEFKILFPKSNETPS